MIGSSIGLSPAEQKWLFSLELQYQQSPSTENENKFMQIEFLKCMENFHDKSLFREYLAAVNNGLNGISRKASTKLKEMERNKTSPYHT